MALTKVKVVRTIAVDVPDLGARIREARKADKRNMTDIASAAGMSVQNWYRIEDEKQMLAEETLRKIEEVLGID